MKMITLLTLVVFTLGCNGLLHSDIVKPFIPGTYHASWKTAFSNAVDTMQISSASEGGSEGYLIIRRTHLEFTNAAKKRGPEYSITNWMGRYNETDKTIVVNANGRVLSFDPANKTLKMGVIIYTKL
jgi:hypothetical protein